MIQQKRNIKKGIFIVSIFIFLIFLANLTPISDLNPNSNENFITDSSINYENESPNSATLNLTEFITGKGTNQTVRLCMENSSSSKNNSNGYFEIPSPAKNMSLNSGDFFFNFNNNYTTDYIIEDDSALYPLSYYKKYNSNPTTSYLIVNSGSIYPSDGFIKLRTNQRSFFNISSFSGLANFTVCANFAGSSFNRENILGFVLNFTYRVSKNANVTIYMKDFYDTKSYKNITNTFEVSSNNTINRLNVTLINENLNYINTSSCSLIRFIIERTDNTNFNTTINLLNLTSFMGLELPITNNSLALDFDLRGYNSTVNGCYVWIRTLNTTKAQNAKLNISLYIANDTMARTYDNLHISGIQVEPSEILDSKIYYYNDYHGDKLTYFKFDLSKTYNLSLFNYFIVIKSNTTEDGIFSLVTLQTGSPGGDGEDREHQIQILNDNGNWSPAKSSLVGAENYLLDASEFKLNITRGYMPSDFKINGIKTLKIQNYTLEDYSISGEPSNSPNLEWGLGRWNYTLNSSLLSNSFQKFKIYLTWNNTYIKRFKFDVNYTAEIYRSDNCTVNFRVNYNSLPEWEFNYTFNLYDTIFTHWNFTRLWFVYRNYFIAHNLTIPDGSEVFNSLKEETLFSNLEYKCISVNTSIAKYSGRYSLNLTSPNSIYNEHSYINFKGILWETSGFMYGDNISVSVEIQDPYGYAPISNKGFINVTLYYPNKTALPGAYLTATNGRISNDGTKLIFDFDNETILDITKAIKLGKDLPGNDPYFLRFFWTNGTLIGCTKVPAYIDSYNISLTDCYYDSDSGKNLLIGGPGKDVVILNDYNLLIASINETTGDIYKPDFFTINTSISESEGTFTYVLDETDLSVHMKNFLQNETILNPNEIIRFKTIIENLNDFADVYVNISVKLVSLANEDWIIAQGVSEAQKLEERGNPNGDNVKELTLDLRIPDLNPDSIWYGYNAPIRQSGAKAIVSVLIQNNKAGTYISNNYSLIVNVSDNIFEGYIIASKLSAGGGSILQQFERQECIYLPNKTTFMVNIYDDNYVSSYNQFYKQFELKLNSDFINITLDPELIYKGQKFTVSSILTTEFGVPIKNESVYYQYYYGGNWINISNSPIKSDSNGSISFEIDTLSLNIENSLIIRLVWLGDTYISNRSKEITVDLNFQNNGISIQSEDDESLVFRSKINYFKVNFKNSGNSVLKITDINIKIDDKHVDSDLINIDENTLSRFEPGEEFDIVIEIDISDIDVGSSLEIYITIYAENILSNEPLLGQVTFEVKVLDKPLTDYVIEYSVFFILAILAIVIILVYLFVKRTNKKIELLIKEKVEERPKVSRYVKVSELKQEKIEEKAEEPKETKELEELKVKEIPTEEKKEEKVIEPVKSEKIEKTDLAVPPKEKVSVKIKKQEKALKKEKKPTSSTEVEKKPLSTKELVKLKKAEKRKGLFKKGGKKPKKLPKKVQVKKAKKKTTTDFDELLKEKGLND